MTPDEKAAAAKVRAAKNEQANHMKPEIILQFQDTDISMDALVEAAKQDFRSFCVFLCLISMNDKITAGLVE